MIFNVIPSEKFKREAKRLVRKFPSLKMELLELNNELEANPYLGTSLGNNTFKIRVSIKSKGKGKGGGARIITYVVNDDEEVFLLTIYDKSEYDIVDDKILKNIIETLRSNN